jgi:uncharacterized protein (TIGR00730 family)
MKRICVYCGSGTGNLQEFQSSAERLATLMVERGFGLVYGGGNIGLMGVVARTVLALGGEVIGVIPKALMDRELGLRSCTELFVVDSMHERKKLMADASDAFIALPGGIGTLEELFETFTWQQLKFHDKPLGLLNVSGYYDQLLAFLRHAVASKFLAQEHLDSLLIASEELALLDSLQRWKPPVDGKWAVRLDPSGR